MTHIGNTMSQSKNHRYRDAVKAMLALAEISINGNQPYDIQVKTESFYRAVLRNGSLGLGESYMDGCWDCQQIDELFAKLAKSDLREKLNRNLKFLLTALMARLSPSGRKSKSHEIGIKHYDIGNDLFRIMLGKNMNYSCAYWKDADNLEQAQQGKMKLICDKILLKPGMKILDIGCGFGSFAKYAAEHYSVTVVGISVSDKQIKYAENMCAGLPIQFRLQDYRSLDEKFDRIVSIGMFEHVGHKYYGTFMKVVHRCLTDDGLFLLHTIGANEPTTRRETPWLEKYIFPGGELPSVRQVGEALEGLFIMEDWHNFGTDYEKTLAAWYQNFTQNWDQLATRYDERFYRMWTFYLLMCQGLFRSRYAQLWQVLLSKSGIVDGYQKYVNYHFTSEPN